MKTEKEVKPKKKVKVWLIVGLFFLTALVWGIASQIEPPADSDNRTAVKVIFCTR